MPGIQAVILSSGFSRRMGRDKLSQDLCGKSVLRHVVDNALETTVGKIVVVLRERRQAVLVPEDRRVSILFNEHADSGMSSSIKAAVLRAGPDYDGLLFLNGDTPFFSGASISRLIELSEENPGKIVCVSLNGTLRGPVIFPRKYIGMLLNLEGENGGREILKNNREDIVPLVLENPDELADIDTPEDLDRAREICRKTRQPVE